MNGGSFTDQGHEAGDRALFARRARALPAADVPSLESVLAAADARECVTSPHGAGARSALAAGLAAACVAALVVISVRAAADFGGKSAIVADFDAGVAATPALNQGVGGMCHDDEGVSCEAPMASFVVASSDLASYARLDVAPPAPEPDPLVCVPALVCMP